MCSPIHVLPCRCLSRITRHLEIWRALLVTRLDPISTKWLISVQRTSSRCALRVFCHMRHARAGRESLPVWSNSVYGSRCPRPTTPLAEMQAQVTAVVSHVSRCNCSATNLTLNSSISVCFPESSMPFTGCVLLWSDGGSRHEFTTHVFEHLSDFALGFSSLVVNVN